MTNYYELYHKHGLPLEEAYYLAEFKSFITKDRNSKTMAEFLRKDICNTFPHFADESVHDICRSFMQEKGYYDEPIPFVFRSSCDFYRNYEKPDAQRIKNTVNYIELYTRGLISLRESYVLAKNKNFLLYDTNMLGMIFAIEDLIFKEMIRSPVFGTKEDTIAAIIEHLNQKPRKQINGYNKLIGWQMEFYMIKEGYTYDTSACNSFIPTTPQ